MGIFLISLQIPKSQGGSVRVAMSNLFAAAIALLILSQKATAIHSCPDTWYRFSFNTKGDLRCVKGFSSNWKDYHGAQSYCKSLIRDYDCGLFAVYYSHDPKRLDRAMVKLYGFKTDKSYWISGEDGDKCNCHDVGAGTKTYTTDCTNSNIMYVCQFYNTTNS